MLTSFLQRHIFLNFLIIFDFFHVGKNIHAHIRLAMFLFFLLGFSEDGDNDKYNDLCMRVQFQFDITFHRSYLISDIHQMKLLPAHAKRVHCTCSKPNHTNNLSFISFIIFCTFFCNLAILMLHYNHHFFYKFAAFIILSSE